MFTYDDQVNLFNGLSIIHGSYSQLFTVEEMSSDTGLCYKIFLIA